MPYMTADQIVSALDDMEATSPGLCTADSCPNRTVENREVRFIKISHPSPPAAPRRAVLIVGGLHVREWAPPDALVSFGRALLEHAVGPAPEYEPQVVSYAPVVRSDKVPPVPGRAADARSRGGPGRRWVYGRKGSGGVLPDCSETAWIPLELRTRGPAGKVEVVS